MKLQQLFRRVAAALPGMEADKKPPEDSKYISHHLTKLPNSFPAILTVSAHPFKHFFLPPNHQLF